MGKYFERVGDLDMKALTGEYRMLQEDTAPISNSPGGKEVGKLLAGQDFECKKAHRDSKDGSMYCQLPSGKWVLTYSRERGLIGEQKIKGFNENKARQPLKDKYGHQMMLVTDFAFVWDSTYNKIVMDNYYTDDDMTDEETKKIVGTLATDFGAAFKKLT